MVGDFPGFFLDYQQKLGQNRRWEDRFTSQELEWSGNVFDFYRRSYNKLKQALKVPFQLKGDRRVDETPAHEALREAIVNALTNADYRSSRGVVFRWTDEGIEIVNPGCFRIGVDQAYHGGMSDARNKTLLKMFSLIEIGERAGSGIPNMVDQWTSCGYGKPELSESFDPEMSRTFLPLDDERKPSDRQDDNLPGGLSERERIALRIAKETGSVITKALVEAANVGRQAASRTLKAMADRDLLEWHGSSPRDPSQHYTVR